jgi:hypothetical protein
LLAVYVDPSPATSHHAPHTITVGDLTWLFWTKLCEKLSLERSFGYAEEEVQR